MGRRVPSGGVGPRPCVPTRRPGSLDDIPPPYRRPELPWERKADPGLGWARWASVGIEFGASVVLFFLGGQALDGKFGTTPWWTVIGSLLGVAAGLYLLFRMALGGETPKPKDGPPAAGAPTPGSGGTGSSGAPPEHSRQPGHGEPGPGQPDSDNH